jgi:hypothetical protein
LNNMSPIDRKRMVCSAVIDICNIVRVFYVRFTSIFAYVLVCDRSIVFFLCMFVLESSNRCVMLCLFSGIGCSRMVMVRLLWSLTPFIL